MHTPPRKAGRRTLLHDLPPWIDPEANDFFVTICCQHRGHNSLCLPGVGEALLQSARFYTRQKKWFPLVFLLMPDHLHMLVSFGYEHAMTKVVASWKRHAATQQGIEWQRGFFEHRLRGHESWEEKTEYILQNPVRAGLIRAGEEWPYLLQLDPRA